MFRLSRDTCFVDRDFSAGFTLIEMVIVFAIITAIASVVLVSFPSLNENIYLQKNAQDISLLIRKAQGRAFAQGVAPLVGSCGFGGVPSGYGVQLKLNSPTYALFADCNGNKQRDVGETIQMAQFDGGLVISRFTDLTGTDFGYPEVDVVFTFAFANPVNSMNIALIDSSGIRQQNPNSIKIILKTPRTNLTKTILMVNTGQISIQ